MTVRSNNKIEAVAEHEGLVAERYRWWGVYLVREQRRLQAIAHALAAGKAAPAAPQPEQPADKGAVDELLVRLDTELVIEQAAAALEGDAEVQGEDETPAPTHPKGKAGGRGTVFARDAAAGEDF